MSLLFWGQYINLFLRTHKYFLEHIINNDEFSICRLVEKSVFISFQQQIPLAGQEFRPQEQPPTMVDSVDSVDSNSVESLQPSRRPSINDDTEEEGTVNPHA